MEQVFIEIAKIAPSIGILAYFVYYFKGELKIKNDEIKELNNQLRENQKETLIAINKMTEVVTDLKELIKEKLS